jgi:precorrin-3B synthase
MSQALRSALRRGWCPGALRPMPTGDGLLVRIHPPGGRLAPDALRIIADLAEATGNGLIDVTGRANLQIRGVRAESHADLVEGLVDGRLVEPDEAGPYRLTLVSPLAGRDPADLIDADRLAATIEELRRTIAGLPPKTCVVVDGGGLSLDAFQADLRLVATGPDSVGLGLPHGRWYGPLPFDHAPALVAAFLGLLADQHRAAPDVVRRLRDVPQGALDAVAATSKLSDTSPPPARRRPAPAGIRPDRDGLAALLFAPAFGRCTAAQLRGLAEIALRHGAADIRLSPWRGFALTGLGAPALVERDLDRLGFILAADDARLFVEACPGAPACARGATAAQADAAVLAEAAAERLRSGLSLHVSGCPKGCARSGIADVTLVGHEGAYHVILDGSVADRPVARLTASELAPILAASGDLRRLLLGVSSS